MFATEADTGFIKRGGGGWRWYGYFILGHFVAGYIMRCMDKMLADKTPVKNSRESKILAILWDREGKMPILSKDFIYHTDG